MPTTEALRCVFDGETPAVHVRNYLSRSSCEQITARFLNNPATRPRSDDVAGLVLGPSSFGRPPGDYFAEVTASRLPVEQLFHGSEETIVRALGDIQRAVWPKVVRPALWQGRRAGTVRALQWLGTGRFALEPHDDQAQLSHPALDGFEIADVRRSIAINIYPTAGKGGGLVMYNFRPDSAARMRLGIEHSGYPYPPEAVAEAATTTLEIRDGDMVVLDGTFVHAVQSTFGDEPRLLLNFFAGAIDERTVITWT